MKKLLIILFYLPLIVSGQQTLNQSIIHDNSQRDYIIHIPASYDGNSSIPLVLCFHGYGGSALGLSYTNFNYVADTAGFIVVYPQGTLLQGVTHWNVGGWTLASNTDDVGFISSLLDSLSDQYNIDQTRIYSTGMSNGGYMSFLLACQLSNRIAAIASVTGSMTPQMYNACDPQRPVPILQIHGTNDQTVPYFGDPTWTESINNVLQFWVDYNNCSALPATYALPDINMFDGSTVERLTWYNGDNSVVTDHLKVIGGGHDWFGVWGNMDIHSSAEIWNFFTQYDINGFVGNSTFVEEIPLINKLLLKCTDDIGREIKERRNGLILYLYDDGTLEKRVIIE